MGDPSTEYRRFFEEYVNTIDSNDPLPLRVASYSLKEDELLGQIVDCCIQYLYLINCPPSLQTYLSKLAVDEVCAHYRANPLSSYEPLKIMQTATKTVAEICRRHLDNETLSKIPLPGNEPLVSALGIKHTRRKMEDRMVFIPRLHALYNVEAAHEAAYYAIFDGHGGPDAATYAVSHFHQFMVESSHYPQDVEKAMRESYAKTDNYFISKKIKGGSTGLVVLHEPELKKLTVSWLGDSQAMLIKAGQPIMLVNPHRPGRPDEVQRIHDGGGYVTELDGICRVNGDLGVSRAFGNSQYKPLVSAEPDVVTVPLDGTEEAIILGCDGFWDVLDARKVHETFYFHVVNQSDSVDLLSKRLVDLAKEFDSTDNISVIAVLLKSPSELTPPSSTTLSVTMETPELEPFRANGALLTSAKHDEDDFGPETDVDTPDDGNPFGWTRPEPLQTFPDLKINPGVRFNNEYVGLDNPFSNNLHDIAEEKSAEDLKAEKEIFNNNEFAAKTFGNDLFGDFEQTNGIAKPSNHDHHHGDAFNLEKSDAAEVTQGLPDVVNIPDTIDLIADEKTTFDNKFERDVFEQEEAEKKGIAEEETINPFDRATPELSAPVVKSNIFDDDQKPVELETLKSLMMAESGTESEQQQEEGFLIVDPIDNTPRDNEFDGRFAVDDVVETGVDGEESEEEWNYYQGDEKRPPSAQQLNNSDVDNMNSPLNPNAAEFVPVSPPSGLVENTTPIKAIPPGLLDDIASSPNWANMDAVEVPDVDTFLEGAKTRPSDVALDPSVEPFVMNRLAGLANAQGGDLDGVQPFDEPVAPLIEPNSLLQDVQEPKQEENTPVVKPEERQESANLLDAPNEEPRGLDLATDMTSSFIDPYTMGQDTNEVPVLEEPKINGFGDVGICVNGAEPHIEIQSFQSEVSAVLERECPEQLKCEPPALLELNEETPLQCEEQVPVADITPINLTEEIQPKVEEITQQNLEPTPAPIADQAAEIVAEPAKEEAAPVVAAAAAATAATAAAAAAAVAAVAATKKSPSKVAAKPGAKPPTPRAAAAKAPLAATKKPAATAPRSPAAPKPAAPKTTAVPAKPAPPKTTVAPRPKPTTTSTARAPATASTATTAASRAAAPKPAVKTTIPPRTTNTTSRPRVPSAPTNGLANGDAKTAKKPAAAEPIVKKTASVTARVPLSARPASATAPTKPATRPLSARPASAKPAATTTAPKTGTTAVRKTAAAPKTNGVSKPEPTATKRAVPTAKAETKTEAKTADNAPGVVANGVE